MRHKVIDLGVTLDEPPGWHVRDSWIRTTRVVALVPNEQRGESAEWSYNCLGVSTARERRDTLIETAEAAMRAHVQQGSPDYALDRWRDGRIAHRYEWTDGVRLIRTRFVEVSARFVEISIDVHLVDPNGDVTSAETRLTNLERVLLPCLVLDDEAGPGH